tara:strand:+ start:327 stop:557 length:231 start_codon:yes stop_codon:yes gene_type:complete
LLKRTFTILFFLFFTTFCFTQTKPYKEYYETGQLKVEGNLVNGKKTGIWKYYHENGQLWYETPYKNGKRDGITIWY